MIELDELLGGPFDSVLDVGGNVGDFAELARSLWPAARITSFEPLADVAKINATRAAGRWTVEQVAISDRHGVAVINRCDPHTIVSTLQAPGPVRREELGIREHYTRVEVRTAPLDSWLGTSAISGRLLVKVDVEGHEGRVLEGARRVLELARCLIVEVQNDPFIFSGSAKPGYVDELARAAGLRFAGLAGAFLGPDGRPLQFDAVYRRP